MPGPLFEDDPHPGRSSFVLAEGGLTRFPPNVEQISVEREAARTWLVTRRNDVVMRFPLDDRDRLHLAALLTAP